VTEDFPVRMPTATDDASGLSATLTLETDDDGAVAAANVEIANSSDEPAIFTVNSDPSAFLMVDATDDHGQVLSTPPRKFATDEPQEFDIIGLEPGASRSWHIHLANWIPADRVPEDGVAGRLVVTVVLTLDERLVLLTVYDTDVRFSRKALGGE
jgi:hypothetical protein